MNILVTGGAGYIGSHFVKAAIRSRLMGTYAAAKVKSLLRLMGDEDYRHLVLKEDWLNEEIYFFATHVI